jgi:hypothetical protein
MNIENQREDKVSIRYSLVFSLDITKWLCYQRSVELTILITISLQIDISRKVPFFGFTYLSLLPPPAEAQHFFSKKNLGGSAPSCIP